MLSERFKFRVFREERPEDPKSKSTTSTMTGENTGGKRMAGANTVSLQTSFGTFSLNTDSNWLFLAVIFVVCVTVIVVAHFMAEVYKCKSC